MIASAPVELVFTKKPYNSSTKMTPPSTTNQTNQQDQKNINYVAADQNVNTSVNSVKNHTPVQSSFSIDQLLIFIPMISLFINFIILLLLLVIISKTN